jgi:hypothetical protein
MARKMLPPFFLGTAGSLTFYKMHGKYFVRAKSSLTAERLKTDPCFAPTRRQASIMAHASKIAAAAYSVIPAFCKEFGHYRMLTGKANLLLKQGLPEDEILAILIEKYVAPIKQQALKETREESNKIKRKRIKRTPKPWYLRKHRGLRMVEWSIGPGKPSIYPMEAVDNMLSMILQRQHADTLPT